VLPVALTGRVPCLVQGPVAKGTVLVTGDTPGTAMAIKTSKFVPGCVVGKSLENIKSNEVVVIEVAVGRL
jgi:molybdenum cofactor biosynthesis enzyme